MTKRDIKKLADDFENAIQEHGKDSLIAQLAFTAYQEGKRKYEVQRKRARDNRNARHEAYISCGMTRVRGSQGGIYYE